ncbi:MAG: lysylphosphatidylglycerol synthase transmembrane domain-containing protein [Bacteroidetes bacterium]|nr:lysylphosphatidylglycerol synthase transmembrane domain-containing protein [Bacteroidota bacterium]
MELDSRKLLRTFRPSRILLPILIGLGTVTFLFVQNFDRQAFENIKWTWNSSFWIFMALMAMVVRDLAYMLRIRALTDHEIGWWRSFIVIMLWEFCSSIVPTMLGSGYFFAIFILTREKINTGRSITAITLSSFQDGVFLALVAPFVYFVIGKEKLFSSLNLSTRIVEGGGSGFLVTFWTVYFIILAYKIFVAYGLFINPRFVKWALIKIFSLPLLNRWRHDARETGDQLIIASKGLKNKSRRFWIESFGGTFISWTARYSLVNCLVLAFTNAPAENFIIFGKQVVMGIIILFTPTPGGSGFAEFMFNKYLSEFIPFGLSASLGLLWRLISYYPYIFIGVILLPKWIKQKFSKEEIAVGTGS